MLFLDESTPHPNIELKKSSRELELLFGLAVVDVLDIQIAEEYNVTTFPSVALYQKCEACERFLYYQKELKTEKNATKSAERVQKWISHFQTLLGKDPMRSEEAEVEPVLENMNIIDDVFSSLPDRLSPVLFPQILSRSHQ